MTVQEFYETVSGQARKRASELRKKGYRVISSSMGNQVTPVGLVKITMLTIYPKEGQDNPEKPTTDIDSQLRQLHNA